MCPMKNDTRFLKGFCASGIRNAWTRDPDSDKDKELSPRTSELPPSAPLVHQRHEFRPLPGRISRD